MNSISFITYPARAANTFTKLVTRRRNREYIGKTEVKGFGSPFPAHFLKRGNEASRCGINMNTLVNMPEILKLVKQTKEEHLVLLKCNLQLANLSVHLELQSLRLYPR